MYVDVMKVTFSGRAAFVMPDLGVPLSLPREMEKYLND
jgi:hypothetical protein